VSYDSEKDKLGKEPFVVVGLVLDKCSLTAGGFPCTATETGDDKCYNTYPTCNDTPNYTRTTQEYLYCQPRSNLPVGINMIPALDGTPEKSPTSITAGKGLGNRAVVRVGIKDFPHHDRGEDPYWNERTYDAESLGTYWGKKLRRNPYYEGRTIKVYHGYLTTPFSWDNFTVEEYDIQDISGPTRGKVSITGKDALVRTYGEKQKYPALSNGRLSADITASAASATLLPAGIGNSEYPASGYVSIGKEVKSFTRSGDVLTFTGHGQYGTEDKAHEEGDTAQLCVTWTNTNAVDALYQVLSTGAGFPSAYLPYDNGATGIDKSWDIEKSQWMSSAVLSGILMKPEDIDKLIAEWSEQFMFDIWWSATDQEVQIKALSPEPPGVTLSTLTEGYHIAKDSLKIKRDSKKRFTEIQVWYNKIDYSEKDEIENFAQTQLSVDLSRSGEDRYGSSSIKVILSRWISDAAQASQLAGRLLARFSDTPEIVEFEIYAKDDAKIGMGVRVELDSWQFQDFSGSNDPRKYQVLEIDEIDPGHKLKVKALTSSFTGRYWFIAPDGTPDYSSATDEQREKYGFICYDTGVFLDGEKAYKII
jgi:hypothetical protein